MDHAKLLLSRILQSQIGNRLEILEEKNNEKLNLMDEINQIYKSTWNTKIEFRPPIDYKIPKKIMIPKDINKDISLNSYDSKKSDKSLIIISNPRQTHTAFKNSFSPNSNSTRINTPISSNSINHFKIAKTSNFSIKEDRGGNKTILKENNYKSEDHAKKTVKIMLPKNLTVSSVSSGNLNKNNTKDKLDQRTKSQKIVKNRTLSISEKLKINNNSSQKDSILKSTKSSKNKQLATSASVRNFSIGSTPLKKIADQNSEKSKKNVLTKNKSTNENIGIKISELEENRFANMMNASLDISDNLLDGIQEENFEGINDHTYLSNDVSFHSSKCSIRFNTKKNQYDIHDIFDIIIQPLSNYLKPVDMLNFYLSCKKNMKLTSNFISSHIEDKIHKQELVVNELCNNSVIVNEKPFTITENSAKAIELLNDSEFNKIYSEDSQLLFPFKVYFQLINHKAACYPDHEFAEVLKDVTLQQKIGDFVWNTIGSINYSRENLFEVYKMMKDKQMYLSSSFYSQKSTTLGLFILVLKEILIYCGIIKDKKSSPKLLKSLQTMILIKLNESLDHIRKLENHD